MAQPRHPDSKHGCPGEGRDRSGAQLRAAHLHPDPVRAHDRILPHPHREAGKDKSIEFLFQLVEGSIEKCVLATPKRVRGNFFVHASQYAVIYLQEPTGLYTNFTLMPDECSVFSSVRPNFGHIRNSANFGRNQFILVNW